ncbi:MAG: AGE family epimerase/isomerase, partial [Acetobacteraceae bacterium]|nr:AGE family epimerase/isomerase [Acetobacteraceae bacterium]
FDRHYGGLHDQMDRRGEPVLTTRRIWPMTEAIKAHVARREAGTSHRDDALIERLIRDYLRPAGVGWIETLSREGTPVLTHMPGSTPYHLFLAAAEVERIHTGRAE